MTSTLLLIASKDSARELTSLFDFVWPTAAAIWNMQWQVKGYRAQMPDATVDEMSARFISGSGIRNVNFKKLEQDSWSDMQGWFAKLLLSETCALFEGWIASALDELNLPAANRKQIEKQLQFPSTLDAAGQATNGLRKALDSIQAPSKSTTMQASFEAPMLASRKNSKGHIENLLICYRVFKEARNSFTHHGGRATQAAEQSYINYFGQTATLLGLKEKPVMPPIAEGNPIQLSLRGVVGFSDVVLRLVHTLDTEFAISPHAERIVSERWLAKHKGLVTLKVDPSQKLSHLRRLVHQCGLPKPIALSSLYAHMQSKGHVA